MKIRAILWDLDGVLADACTLHYNALNEALKQVCGFIISKEEHDSLFNALPTKKKLEILENQGRIKKEQIDQIVKVKQKETICCIFDEIKPDKNKILTFKALRRNGIKNACVTNSIMPSASLILSQLGLLTLLDLLVTNELVQHNKPSGEPYIYAMVKLGMLPAECLIIEDSIKGIEAAKVTGANLLKVENSESLEIIWPRIKEYL